MTPTPVAPVWPPAGCQEMSYGVSDLTSDAAGVASAEQAALGVDEHAAFVRVGLIEGGGGGWLVSEVQRCSD